MLDQLDRPATTPTSSSVPRSPTSSTRRTAWLLVIGGAIGLTAAFTLLVEKIALLEDPDYVPSCSINPILSCGSIMRTAQAEVFGFPNPIIGVVGFAVVITVAVGVLAGASFPRWFWLGLQAGVTFGVLFIHWLVFQSLYRIDALCPYCMVVWVVVIPMFWYTTLHNIDGGHIRVPVAARRIVDVVAGYHGVVLTAWYLVIAGLVAERFWDYWSTVLT